MAGQSSGGIKRILGKIFKCFRKKQNPRTQQDPVPAEQDTPLAAARTEDQPSKPAETPAAHAHAVAQQHEIQQTPHVVRDTQDDEVVSPIVDSPHDRMTAPVKGPASAVEKPNAAPESSQNKLAVPEASMGEISPISTITNKDAAAATAEAEKPAHTKDVKHEEPMPPIKSVQAAPGMSATSGPLEDFPEVVEADD